MAVATAFDIAPATSATLKVLHAFQNGADGSIAQNPLTMDDAGNLYGMTYSGGGSSACVNGGGGCGVVFRIAPDGSETVLHAFAFTDGAYPFGTLIVDKAGNLYGTTTESSGGNGMIFELAPDGTETILHNFQGGSDGAVPTGNLAMDRAGNIFGTTVEGGSGCQGSGCGTVFKLHSGTETVLHSFHGGSDGVYPGGVILDSNGNLFGVTGEGGGACGCGTVFKIGADGTDTVLYAFQGGNDGAFPSGPLLVDGSGNLYGTTESGGGTGCGSGCGTVFRLSPDGTETVLYAFKGGSDGQEPFYSGVVSDDAGNLYGTTEEGGGATHCHHLGCGTVFKVATDGTERVLSALYAHHGRNPGAGLVKGPKGLLYGTADFGGGTGCINNLGCGVVFRVKK